MARQKRTSAALVTARQRFAGLNQITPAPNLGPNLTLAAYQGVMTDGGAIEKPHKHRAAQMDASPTRSDTKTARGEDGTRRILSAVEAQYGPDSSEYEMCGGTRKSERRKPTR